VFLWIRVGHTQNVGGLRFSLLPVLTDLGNWALLEKLPIVQPLKNFPTSYGNRRFITVFTRALHLSLSWARSIQSIPSHPISLRSILILSTHLCLGLGLGLGLHSGLFPIFQLNTKFQAIVVCNDQWRFWQQQDGYTTESVGPGPFHIWFTREKTCHFYFQSKARLFWVSEFSVTWLVIEWRMELTLPVILLVTVTGRGGP
jgi:hypothetical protein